MKAGGPMKPIIFWLSVISLCLVPHPAFSDAPDGGWYKTRWGMSEAQLSAVFGAELKPLTPPVDTSGETLKFSLESFKVGKFDFRVFFSMTDDNRLKAVLLRRDDFATGTGCFEFVARSLINKYGPFFDRGRETNFDANDNEYEIFRYEWITPGTSIKLRHYFDRDPKSSTIIITYYCRSLGAPDNL
jgi:hypothetical protein